MAARNTSNEDQNQDQPRTEADDLASAYLDLWRRNWAAFLTQGNLPPMSAIHQFFRPDLKK
jgi:hypothetical protein